jgi:hypothetical protein
MAYLTDLTYGTQRGIAVGFGVQRVAAADVISGLGSWV